MRALAVIPLSALALTTALVWPHVATASPGPSTLHLSETFTTYTEVDLGKKGPSQGDTFAFTTKVVDSDGEPAGTAGGSGTSLKPDDDTLGLVQYSETYDLDGGQLVIEGFYDFGAKPGTPTTDAVIGGTGKYRGAKGQVDFVTKGTDTFISTFKIRY